MHDTTITIEKNSDIARKLLNPKIVIFDIVDNFVKKCIYFKSSIEKSHFIDIRCTLDLRFHNIV